MCSRSGLPGKVDQRSSERFGSDFVLGRRCLGLREHVVRRATAVAEEQVGTLVADYGQLKEFRGTRRIEQDVGSVGRDSGTRDSAIRQPSIRYRRDGETEA